MPPLQLPQLLQGDLLRSRLHHRDDLCEVTQFLKSATVGEYNIDQRLL